MRGVEFVEIRRGGLGDFVPFLLLTLKHFYSNYPLSSPSGNSQPVDGKEVLKWPRERRRKRPRRRRRSSFLQSQAPPPPTIRAGVERSRGP